MLVLLRVAAMIRLSSVLLDAVIANPVNIQKVFTRLVVFKAVLVDTVPEYEVELVIVVANWTAIVLKAILPS